jgi:hypothetical protein
MRKGVHMKGFAKGILAALVVIVFGVGVAIATATTSTNPISGAADISGPCDEAENANDPRCAGSGPATAAMTETVGDVSGPCDEAEHATDPRCTGATSDRDDDRSGRSGGSRESGPSDNAGSGNGEGDRESGPGSRNSGAGGSDSRGDDSGRP